MLGKTKYTLFLLLLAITLLTAFPGSIRVHAQATENASAQPIIDETLQAQLASSEPVSYWIMFRQTADLNRAGDQLDWTARGEYVYDRLQENARLSQARVRTYLDLLGVHYTSYWINNSILVEASSSKAATNLLVFGEIESLQARKNFALIEPIEVSIDATGDPKGIEANLTHINADDAWALGITGTGIVVANIDTGVRYTHQTLVTQYRGNLGGGNFEHNYNWYDPYGDYPTAPADGHGHGSHTMGIMVGSDGGSNQIGVASGAQWIACRGCNTSDCADAALLSCAEFMVAPTDLAGENPDPSKRPHVVNNSWGDCATSYDNWYQGAVDAWLAAGIYPVFSNGNAGNCTYSYPPGLNTVGNPARYGNVTGVGSTGTSDGLYATHSNWGPTDNLDTVNPRGGFPEMKPQVLAPGVSIRSAYRYGDTSYAWSTGTSMSAPHVAGLVALIWQAGPCLERDYAATESLIEETAVHITYVDGSAATPSNYPNYATGWGEIDAMAAVQGAAQACSGTLQGVITDQVDGKPIEGAQVHIFDPVKLDQVVTSSPVGTYSLGVLAGSYTVEVSIDGYYPASATVWVSVGLVTAQDFSLLPWMKFFLPTVLNN